MCTRWDWRESAGGGELPPLRGPGHVLVGAGGMLPAPPLPHGRLTPGRLTACYRGQQPAALHGWSLPQTQQAPDLDLGQEHRGWPSPWPSTLTWGGGAPDALVTLAALAWAVSLR